MQSLGRLIAILLETLLGLLACSLAAEAAVHHVHIRKGRTAYQGSAVSFKRDGKTHYLLTAAHVVQHGEGYITGNDKEWVRFRVLAKDAGPDVALIVAEIDKPVRLNPLASTSPKRGDPVTMVGFPKSQLRVSKATVLDTDRFYYGNTPMLRTSVQSISGESGGAILNAKGELVGIISSHGKGDCISAPLSALRAIAKKGGDRQSRPVVLVFTSPGCPPCEKAKRDHAAGKWPTKYDYKFVPYTDAKGYSIPGTPVFYVQGQSKPLAVGYSGPRGLIGHLVAFFRDVLIGSPGAPPQQFGNDSSLPRPGTPSAVIDDVKRIRDDVDRIKNGSIFDKIPAIIALKRDVAKAKADTAELREKLKDVPQKINEAKAEVAKTVGGVASDVKKTRDDVKAILDADGPIEKAKRVPALIADVDRFKYRVDKVERASSEAKNKIEEHGTVRGIFWILASVFGLLTGSKSFADGKK